MKNWVTTSTSWICCTTLYNFKPADADFKITLNRDDQNDKVKEKWDTNFKWDADNYTLTLSPVWALYNFNFNDKKVSDMTEANNGVKLSWTFNAGKGETTSNGNEQWYIKDPVRQPVKTQSTWGLTNSQTQRESSVQIMKSKYLK